MANLQDNTESEVENNAPSSDTPSDSSTKEALAEDFKPAESPTVDKQPAIQTDPVHQADSVNAAIDPLHAPEGVPKQVPEQGSDEAQKQDPLQADAVTETKTAAVKPDPNEPNSGAQKPEPIVTSHECQQKLATVLEEITRISYKNTNQLLAIRSVTSYLGKNIRSLPLEADQALLEAFTGCQQQLDSKLEKNREHQQNLLTKSKELADLVKQALEEGKTQEALLHWDRLQGNISNTSGKLQTELHSLANEHKNKLNELRDWKTFAATEKKKELIQHIQQLLESRMHAGDKAKRIAALHKDWKALGKSHQNESLWKQFKTISDKAYEPCKEHFKQRKQLMASNLIERKKICAHLEDYISELNKQLEVTEESDIHAINIANLSKIEAKAKEEWKRYAPLEQAKVKAIQKRYHGALNQLRTFRKSTLKTNARLKQELVDKAQKLIGLEDNKQAMRDAQKLQQEWKQIGPGSYREDNQYWQTFRAACDEIFKARDDQRKQDKEIISNAESQLINTLQALQSLAEQDDDQLRAARGSYHDLQQQFSSALDPRIKKDRKRYLDKFNDCKRSIDHRLQTMPDKKQQQQKDNLQARADFCLQHELMLSASDSEEQFQLSKSQFDVETWKALTACGNEELDRAMEQRQTRLTHTPSLQAWQALKQDQAEAMTTLCIELEIRSDIESPKTDQALRMKVQLDQLKAGFGQQKPSRKENLDQALHSALLALCMGPLDADAHQAFEQRISQCLAKLR